MVMLYVMEMFDVSWSVDLVCLVFFFFVKQKTAYEMRISDWSSDVCSSDLVAAEPGDLVCAIGPSITVNGTVRATRRHADGSGRPMPSWRGCILLRDGAIDRKSVV